MRVSCSVGVLVPIPTLPPNVASVVVPVVVRLVEVAYVAVRFVRKDVAALNTVEKKLDVVADAPIAERKLREEIVEDAWVDVASVVNPVTVSDEVAVKLAVVIAEVEALVIEAVEALIEVKVGVADTAIVEVDESMIFDPAIK